MAAAVPYVLVLGLNNDVADGISETDSLRQILHWIGFRTTAQQDNLIRDSFTSYVDLQGLYNKDIDKMRTEFAARTAATGKITFGTIRTKYIKSLVH